MKIYNYKNGEKAIFVNNKKIVITAKEAEVLDSYIYGYVNAKATGKEYSEDAEAVLAYIREGKVETKIAAIEGIEVTLWIVDREPVLMEAGDITIWKDNCSFKNYIEFFNNPI